MVNIKWCLGIRNGLELIEQNKNMSYSYLEMAKESLDMIKNVSQSKIWKASTCYYTMYYSLYSLMMKIGIKCEIHSCSLEFMKQFLKSFYSENEVELIKKAFDVRNNLQYYPDKLMKNFDLLNIEKGTVEFFVKTKSIISEISESQIDEIISKLREAKE